MTRKAFLTALIGTPAAAKAIPMAPMSPIGSAMRDLKVSIDFDNGPALLSCREMQLHLCKIYDIPPRLAGVDAA